MHQIAFPSCSVNLIPNDSIDSTVLERISQYPQTSAKQECYEIGMQHDKRIWLSAAVLYCSEQLCAWTECNVNNGIHRPSTCQLGNCSSNVRHLDEFIMSQWPESWM